MKVITLAAEPRTKLGSAESRRLRKAGRIPVNLYGLGRDPANLTVEAHVFGVEFERGGRMFELKAGDKTQICLLKDLQYDALGDVIQHIDLFRVDDTKPVTVNVSVSYTGTPESPRGANVDTIRDSLTVRSLPRSIPDSIEVDISELPVGERITASQVKLPDGVELEERAEATMVTHHFKSAGVAAAAEGEAEGEGEGDGETTED